MKKITISLTLILVLTLSVLAQAATLTVGQGPRYGLSTIQDGIDLAVDGDTVIVLPGEYVITEPITFRGKAITVRSEEGPDETTIRMAEVPMGWSTDSALVFFNNGEDAGSLLEGFTLTGSMGSGVFCIGSSPSLENCVMTANYERGVGCLSSSPTITNCIISGSMGDSGVNCRENSSPTITNCIIWGNRAYGSGGGGIFCNDSSPTITNCIISGNDATFGIGGGGVQCIRNSSATLINCTISGNSAGEGGGVYCDNSSLILTNCIVWDNVGGAFLVDGELNVQVNYSCIEGDEVWSGVGNTNVDPQFVDPVNMDYRLQAGSPCIDAGDNSVVPRSRYEATDLDGNPRIVNGIVDMGAYEFSPESDIIEAGLVAYYPLNTGRGTIIRDASGNNRDGIAQAPPEWVNGPIGYGRALYFDGSNPARAWVNCGTWNPSAGTNQLTIAFWIRWDGPAVADGQMVIAKYDYWDAQGTGQMWAIRIHGDKHTIEFFSVGHFPSCGDRVLPIGQWSHVAVTFDGVTMIFYVDGEETGRGEFSFGPKTDSAIIIGAADLVGSFGFHGALDEIRLYKKALDPVEINSLAANYGAFNPQPADGSTYTESWVTLSWSPGVSAISHDIYFGDNRDNVDTGTGDTFKGNQTETWFTIGSIRSPYLIPGKTYYWRIDEIDAEGTIYKGDIWSLTFPPDPSDEGDVIELTEMTFDQIALGSDTPVLVDFWAPWCGPCLKMAPVLEEIAKEYAGRVKVCKLDTDTSPNINSRYEIRAIPTFILFKNGQIRQRWLGVTPKEDLTAAIDSLL